MKQKHEYKVGDIIKISDSHWGNLYPGLHEIKDLTWNSNGSPCYKLDCHEDSFHYNYVVLVKSKSNKELI